MRLVVIGTLLVIVAISVPAYADLIAQGKSFYNAKKYRCAICHGKSGKGGAGPSFQGIGEKYTQEELMGRAAHNCPPTGSCNPKELGAIVTYLRTL